MSGGAIFGLVFFLVCLLFLVIVGVALTKKRHGEGRSMWEKSDAPWNFAKRNRPGRPSGDVGPE